MRPPASVRIGPHRWTIRRQQIDADEELYGRTVERELVILVAPSHPSQERDTVLHELLHAIWAHTGLSDYDDDQQEQIVRSLSTPLLGALRNNPRLLAFLLEK